MVLMLCQETANFSALRKTSTNFLNFFACFVDNHYAWALKSSRFTLYSQTQTQIIFIQHNTPKSPWIADLNIFHYARKSNWCGRCTYHLWNEVRSNTNILQWSQILVNMMKFDLCLGAADVTEIIDQCAHEDTNCVHQTPARDRWKVSVLIGVNLRYW